ncbi:MAG: ribosome assembly cofactor RimP [Fermentimonas sp.]|jgi:ribosome maturation factor RimP|nr:ribosome assembly cofactor RimP [Fermentimonas sp.]NLC85610.1 ribosome assembly cofactor RimP [Bacteroidales bacterium]HBT86206.1 ribosome assembly cofactor RimP [Porphyromonadaceae bacterium]MDD2930587.1 ribosome assembly cofactor RimP [Fermentimonas sp.]MDD3188492.1 ribosome assembly cofactor RimP [Fermentimonas sp.]
MFDKNVLVNIIEDYLKDSPNYLVDIYIGAGNSITVEIDNDNGVDIDDCVELSRHIESKLDRDSEDFELTVTSVGLTSPFKSSRQYRKYEGKEIEVLSKKGTKLTGVLKSSDDKGFTITVVKQVKPEGAKRKIDVYEDIYFMFEEVKHTKYLIRFK